MIITDVEYAFDDSEIFNLQFYEYAVPFFLNKIVVTLSRQICFGLEKSAFDLDGHSNATGPSKNGNLNFSPTQPTFPYFQPCQQQKVVKI